MLHAEQLIQQYDRTL